MAGHTCYHCKAWVEQGEAHDCWTTTEAALTADLDDDLREAWERLRETAAELGEQRIYASHKSIMFSRTSCYVFVRPKRTFLEVNVFLGRVVTHPMIRKVIASSATKRVHVIRLVHRDQVEAPLTDWLREAYDTTRPPEPWRRRKGTKGGTKGTKRSGTKGTKKSGTKGTKRSGTKGTKKSGTKATKNSTRKSTKKKARGARVRKAGR